MKLLANAVAFIAVTSFALLPHVVYAAEAAGSEPAGEEGSSSSSSGSAAGGGGAAAGGGGRASRASHQNHGGVWIAGRTHDGGPSGANGRGAEGQLAQ